MATVWRVYDHRLKVWRAAKVLAPEYGRRQRLRSRFDTEAQTMALLEHPNIVRVYDLSVEGTSPYIVMELCDGTVVDWLDRWGAMPPRLAVRILIDVCAGISVAHARGIIHRDIKPHNVLIGTDGIAKISDFGIARLMDQQELSSHLTRTGSVMGTLGYMAPEQRNNAKTVDVRADVYSLGATLHTLLTNRTTLELFAANQDESLLDGVHPLLVPIVMRATAYRREDRYGSAEAFAAALRECEPRLPALPEGLAPLQTPQPTPAAPIDWARPPSSTPSRPPARPSLTPMLLSPEPAPFELPPDRPSMPPPRPSLAPMARSSEPFELPPDRPSMPPSRPSLAPAATPDPGPLDLPPDRPSEVSRLSRPAAEVPDWARGNLKRSLPPFEGLPTPSTPPAPRSSAPSTPPVPRSAVPSAPPAAEPKVYTPPPTPEDLLVDVEVDAFEAVAGFVHYDCKLKRSLAGGRPLDGCFALHKTLRLHKNAERLSAAAQRAGVPVADAYGVFFGSDGTFEGGWTDIQTELAPTLRRGEECAGCPARLQPEPFGCAAWIDLPVSSALEGWLMQRLEPGDRVGGKLVIQTIDKQKYSGKPIAALRQAGRFESKTAISRSFRKGWLSSVQITSDQVLHGLLYGGGGGGLEPNLSFGMLLWFGALQIDGNRPEDLEIRHIDTALGMMTPDERMARTRLLLGSRSEDRGIQQAQQLLHALYLSWVQGVRMIPVL